MKREASFGAGCFWHVELAFSKVGGVLSTEVGFMGGRMKNPSYSDVSYRDTGHAEVVHIIYDDKDVSYEKLLGTFWKIHDPTQKNRQGLDIGSQYRGVIFYYTEKQKKLAQDSKKEQQKKYDKKIQTQVRKAGTFYKAEEYHQKYLKKRGRNTC